MRASFDCLTVVAGLGVASMKPTCASRVLRHQTSYHTRAAGLGVLARVAGLSSARVRFFLCYLVGSSTVAFVLQD